MKDSKLCRDDIVSVTNFVVELLNEQVRYDGTYKLKSECPLVYLWHREDNPMCGEEGFYDPTSETEWPKRL